MGNLGDAAVHTRSVLKPYGVWGVISPFNFPFALSGGPSGGALVAGNTVVYKPSLATRRSRACACSRRCATPASRTASSTWSLGPGETVGAELQENDGVDGIIFTGSFEVGFDLYKNFASAIPKPVIVEMGGKNPAIVSRHADLDEAAEGVMRVGVRLQRPEVLGQQPGLRRAAGPTTSSSSGSSRRPRRSRSATRSTARTGWARSSTSGRSTATTQRRRARRAGTAGSLVGGERVTEDGLDAGYFVAPTVVGDLPTDHRLFRDELFVPFTAVAAGRLDRRGAPACQRQRPRPDGRLLQRGRGRDRAAFLDEIEAGVVYVNRRAGATTGAWPGVQPFGGWKGSTATGKSGGGFYYVQQFMREQSQTVVD